MRARTRRVYTIGMHSIATRSPTHKDTHTMTTIRSPLTRGRPRVALHPLTLAAFVAPPTCAREAEEVLSHYHAPEALRTGDVRSLRIVHGCKLVLARLGGPELASSVRVLAAAWSRDTAAVIREAEDRLVELVNEYRARFGGGS